MQPIQLRGLTRCMFRDTLLHTTVVMCGYLHYWHLPVSFDQSFPSPLTSFMTVTRVFAHRTAAHWLFLVFYAILCKLCVNIPLSRSAVSEILKPFCLAPTIIPMSKSFRSHLFPNLEFGLKNNWTSWPCLNVVMHFVATTWLADQIFAMTSWST